MKMHRDQVDVTAAQVKSLVSAQFPEWADRPVTVVRSHGTVNALFRIGDDLVARLPIESGEPGPGYALPWSVYRWLSGAVAHDADVADSSPFAKDLAEFVRALRSAPTEGRVFTGSRRGGLLTAHDEWVATCLDRSRSMIDVDALSRLWADLRTTTRAAPDTWTHGDLMPGNLLADQGHLAGIIDVGQFGVADPALDLQPAWNLMDPSARATFRSAVGSDDDEWRRGEGWAFAQAIGSLWYYRETNPVMSSTARRTLETLLTDR